MTANVISLIDRMNKKKVYFKVYFTSLGKVASKQDLLDLLESKEVSLEGMVELCHEKIGQIELAKALLARGFALNEVMDFLNDSPHPIGIIDG